MGISARPGARHSFMVVLHMFFLCVLGCFSPPESGTYADGPRAPRPPRAVDGLRLGPHELPTPTLRFGLAPIVSADLMVTQHQGLADYLAEVLGVPVELSVAESYGALVDSLISGKLDIAILPPATYALGRSRSPDIKLLASQVAGGATSYSSYIVVRRTAAFEDLKDLIGKGFSFVDEASASGFILPWSAFLNHDMDPRTAFASIHFAGNHVNAIADVLEGRADAAATYSGMLDFTRRAGAASPDAANLRILHKAGRVPYDALCGSPLLESSVADRIAEAFMSVDTSSAKGRRIYAATTNHVSGWARPDEARYRSILETMERVRLQRATSPGGPHEP